MSPCVLAQPVETRIVPLASAPMALRTWLGLTLPEAQAEPLESAMPSKSNAMSKVSDDAPGSEKSVVFEMRGAFWE